MTEIREFAVLTEEEFDPTGWTILGAVERWRWAVWQEGGAFYALGLPTEASGPRRLFRQRDAVFYFGDEAVRFEGGGFRILADERPRLLAHDGKGLAFVTNLSGELHYIGEEHGWRLNGHEEAFSGALTDGEVIVLKQPEIDGELVATVYDRRTGALHQRAVPPPAPNRWRWARGWIALAVGATAIVTAYQLGSMEVGHRLQADVTIDGVPRFDAAVYVMKDGSSGAKGIGSTATESKPLSNRPWKRVVGFTSGTSIFLS